ncbi:MAG: helix-turn-helix domain-containing protein [Cryobacterium sp.]|nr:helix-turn-helix domain-containing protein [Oligoflexia bacterium]
MVRGYDLGDFLRKSRLNVGLSQKEVASVLGYKSSQFVSNWERGLSSPPIATFRRLCELYRTSESEMFQIVREIAVKKLEDELKRDFFGESESQEEGTLKAEEPEEAVS